MANSDTLKAYLSKVLINKHLPNELATIPHLNPRHQRVPTINQQTDSSKGTSDYTLSLVIFTKAILLQYSGGSLGSLSQILIFEIIPSHGTKSGRQYSIASSLPATTHSPWAHTDCRPSQPKKIKINNEITWKPIVNFHFIWGTWIGNSQTLIPQEISPQSRNALKASWTPSVPHLWILLLRERIPEWFHHLCGDFHWFPWRLFRFQFSTNSYLISPHGPPVSTHAPRSEYSSLTHLLQKN